MKIPVLIVGNKTDSGQVLQDYIYQPAAFCSKYKLPPPHFSCKEDKSREIFIKLATMAAFPRFQPAWMLFYQGGAAFRDQFSLGSSAPGGGGSRGSDGGGSSILKWVSTIGLGMALVTGVFFITARIWPAEVPSRLRK